VVAIDGVTCVACVKCFCGRCEGLGWWWTSPMDSSERKGLPLRLSCEKKGEWWRQCPGLFGRAALGALDMPIERRIASSLSAKSEVSTGPGLSAGPCIYEGNPLSDESRKKLTIDCVLPSFREIKLACALKNYSLLTLFQPWHIEGKKGVRNLSGRSGRACRHTWSPQASEHKCYKTPFWCNSPSRWNCRSKVLRKSVRFRTSFCQYRDGMT